MGIIKEQTLGILTVPPKFGCGLSVIGGVPELQRYDAIAASFEPDYTITPLTIQVDVAAIDSDTAFSSVNARTMLTNIHWYEIAESGAMTEIVMKGSVSTPTGYASLKNSEGDADAGQLQVCKNAAPGAPILLMFEADLNTGSDLFHIAQNFSVRCLDVTPSVRCKFDMPDVLPYNPIHDADDMPFILTVWENDSAADPANYIPVWEVFRGNGQWTEYGTEITDYWLDIADDKCSAVLHRNLMGYSVSVRVRLKYDRDGNPAAVSLSPSDTSVPMCRMECVRSLGKYDYSLLNVTNTLADWTTVVRPEVVFKDNQGNIIDPDKHFRVTMYAGPGGSALTASNAVGVGRIQNIPAKLGGPKGLKIGVSVDEIGPLLAWADTDGSILTDADGSILLIR